MSTGKLTAVAVKKKGVEFSVANEPVALTFLVALDARAGIHVERAGINESREHAREQGRRGRLQQSGNEKRHGAPRTGMSGAGAGHTPRSMSRAPSNTSQLCAP